MSLPIVTSSTTSAFSSSAAHDDDASGTKSVYSQDGEDDEDAPENISGDSQIRVGDGNSLATRAEDALVIGGNGVKRANLHVAREKGATAQVPRWFSLNGPWDT